MRTVEVICMIGFTAFLLAFVMLIVGFSVPYWVEFDGASDSWQGLWQICDDVGDDDECDNIDIGEAKDWFRATVALMACSLIFALVGGLASMFLPVTSGLQIIAGLFAAVGLGIYYSEMDDDFGEVDGFKISWGFGLACAGGAILIVNGLCLACYAGYLGCYVDPVAPCCRDFGRRRKRSYYDEDYDYRGPPPPVYPSGPRPSVAYPSQPRPSMYGRPAPTLASTGYGTAYQPQPRASVYPGAAAMPRGSVYRY